MTTGIPKPSWVDSNLFKSIVFVLFVAGLALSAWGGDEAMRWAGVISTVLGGIGFGVTNFRKS